MQSWYRATVNLRKQVKLNKNVNQMCETHSQANIYTVNARFSIYNIA